MIYSFSSRNFAQAGTAILVCVPLNFHFVRDCTNVVVRSHLSLGVTVAVIEGIILDVILVNETPGRKYNNLSLFLLAMF